MTDLLDLAARSSTILAAALVAAGYLHRRPAALRHALVAGALFAAAAVGPLGSVLPAWTVSVPAAPSPASDVPGPATSIVPASQDTVERTASAVAPGGAATLWARRVAVPIWLAGVCMSLLGLLLSYLRLRRLAGSARRLDEPTWQRLAREARRAAGLRRRVTLLETDAPDVLATWGLARPRILVPAHARGWQADRIRAVLCHEMAHIARYDWPVQAAAEVVLALHWYNPLAWLAARRLRLESERACDDAVLRRGMAARDYAAQLVEIARACRVPAASPIPTLSMARHPDLHARIKTMLNSTAPAQALSRRALALVVLALVAIAVPLSAVRISPSEPRPLAGVVYDPTGAVAPGAKVAIEGERQVRLEAVSDASGRFELAPVGPGRYALTVSLPGFRTLKQTLELQREGDWERAITLQLGDVQETITIRSARLPAPQPTATPARVRVGGKISPPRKLRDVHPVYPESMRAAGVEGTVALEAIIGRDGSVRSARVVSGLVHPDLGQAAVDAVRQWRFEPTTLNGTPVEVVMNVAITFELE